MVPSKRLSPKKESLKVKISITAGRNLLYTTVQLTPTQFNQMRAIELPSGVDEVDLELDQNGLAHPNWIYRELANYLTTGNKSMNLDNSYHRDAVLTAHRLGFKRMEEDYLNDLIPRLERMGTEALITFLGLTRLTDVQANELYDRYK